MPLTTKNIQNYILPIGLAFIVVLMITNTFVTTSKIESNHESINKILSKETSINSKLTIMSNAVFQRSVILFEMFQSNDPFIVDELMLDLNEQATRFTVARESLFSLDISQNKKEYLDIQSKLSYQNANAIPQMVEHLIYENHEQATIILNEQVLPIMKSILDVIKNLQKEGHKSTEIKLSEIDELSHEEVHNISFFNLGTIIISLLLMLFLIRKQRQSDTDLTLLANTDPLTKLSNRENFIAEINYLLSKEPNTPFSIIFFDVDYFKSINDIYGHEVGDKVLKLFANFISSLISYDDVLARFGGDEFVLLLKNEKNHKDLLNFVKNISNSLDTSFHVDNNEIYISASIGVSTYPNDGATSKKLLKNADIAMYSAKESGRNCYQFYSIENSEKQEIEHKLSHSLQTILKNKNNDNQLSLVYQPLVNVNDEDFNECEALIRWKDKNGDYVNTGEFIEIAEKSNLIQKVNMFVIEEACKQQSLWQQQGIPNIRIHINLSGNKRIFSELFKYLSKCLYKYDLSPTLFGIELTERTIYEVSEETNKNLEHFRSLGMKVSIDDFGTGYSSLSYLKHLPITSVKIDRAFIVGLPHEKIDVALVKAIITLAHSLDYDVVAEGVETQQQFDFLKSCNCNIAQGYLLHRPLKPNDISQLKLVA